MQVPVVRLIWWIPFLKYKLKFRNSPTSGLSAVRLRWYPSINNYVVVDMVYIRIKRSRRCTVRYTPPPGFEYERSLLIVKRIRRRLDIACLLSRSLVNSIHFTRSTRRCLQTDDSRIEHVVNCAINIRKKTNATLRQLLELWHLLRGGFKIVRSEYH